MATPADPAFEPGPTTPVADAAGCCLHSFQECIRQAASIHPRELSLVEDQLARFSIWIANIKVFVPGRASLDHRLREALDVQDAVMGLLEALDLRSACLTSLQSRKTESIEAPLEDIAPIFDESLKGITNEISLLHRFSNTIRRASKESQNLKAIESFRIRDDEGNDVEAFLTMLFANHIRDRFPDVNENIRHRLAATMLIRRKRILYRRSRYGNTAIRPTTVPSQPQVTLPTLRIRPGPSGQPQEKQKAPTEIPRSAIRSLAQTATTLAADSFQRASAPSVISVSKTVALGNHEELAFPPAPLGIIKRKFAEVKKRREEAHKTQLDSAVMSNTEVTRAEVQLQQTLKNDWNECVMTVGEVTCPFCFYALPAQDVVEETKWKLHAKNDLDAYVCIFEDCDSPEELYTHSTEWLKHIREHATRWHCTSKQHGKLSYDSRDAYLTHMKDTHEGKFSEAQLRVLADRNGRVAGPLFKSCPLCGQDEVDGSMEDHVVGHLRFLALKSLPNYNDDVLEMPEDQYGSSINSQHRNRSTIVNDAERDDDVMSIAQIPWHLKGLSWSEITWGTSNHSGKFEPVGGFQKYIFSFPQGENTNDSEYRYLDCPFPPDGMNLEAWYNDSSSEFVDNLLFVGVPVMERRHYEWGFAFSSKVAFERPEDDPLLQAFQSSRQGAWTIETRHIGSIFSEPESPDSDLDLKQSVSVRSSSPSVDDVSITVNHDIDITQNKPEEIADEIVRVSMKLSGVQWRDVDLTNLTMEVAFKGPWGVGGDRITFNVFIYVSPGYPTTTAPLFDIEETPSMPWQTRATLLSKVEALAATALEAKENCLERVFLYLLGESDLGTASKERDMSSDVPLTNLEERTTKTPQIGGEIQDDEYTDEKLPEQQQTHGQEEYDKSQPSLDTIKTTNAGDKIEAKDEVVRCICGFDGYPGFTFFVQCVTCKIWQHGACVGIITEKSCPEEYFCEECRKDLHEIYTAGNGQRYSHYLPAAKAIVAPQEARSIREREDVPEWIEAPEREREPEKKVDANPFLPRPSRGHTFDPDHGLLKNRYVKSDIQQFGVSENREEEAKEASSIKPGSSQEPNVYTPLEAPKMQDYSMDPDCSICGGPASLTCDCESKALEIAVRQAESKMMHPLHNDIRNWARNHAQDLVLRDFKEYKEHLESDTGTAQQGTEHATNDQTLSKQQLLNEGWSTEVQSYPQTLEYFFSLVELNVPPDDDPIVNDPPLSILTKNTKEVFKQGHQESPSPRPEVKSAPEEEQTDYNAYRSPSGAAVFDAGVGPSAPGWQQTAPRQRTSIACKYCRRRKIRCSGYQNTPDGKCTNCKRLGIECIFQPVSSSSSTAFIPVSAVPGGVSTGTPLYGAYGQPLAPAAPAAGRPPYPGPGNYKLSLPSSTSSYNPPPES